MADRAPSSKAADAEGIIPESVECPFCEGTDTRLVSPFGGQMSVAQYWCNRCRTGFDFIKWEHHDDEP
jgi:C4-type Zn-finger protein